MRGSNPQDEVCNMATFTMGSAWHPNVVKYIHIYQYVQYQSILVCCGYIGGMQTLCVWNPLAVTITLSHYFYTRGMVVSLYKESRNNKPTYGYMLPNLSPNPNLYKVQSVYKNNVAS